MNRRAFLKTVPALTALAAAAPSLAEDAARRPAPPRTCNRSRS